MSKPVVRPLEKDDYKQWRKLWTGYLEFYESSVPEEVYETTFARMFLDDVYEPRCLLSCDENIPVGLVHFFQHRHCWRVENVFYLQDLFVDPTVRGGGYGRALIEAVYAEADRLGCPTVYWTTATDNPAAKLYDQVAKRTKFIKYQR